MPELRVVSVTDEATLAAHTNEWEALLCRSAANRSMLTPFWLLTWWRLFGRREGRQLVGLLFFEGDRLVGLAPLARRMRWHRGLIPIRRIELVATGEDEVDEIASDYVGVIAERGQEQVVADAVAAALVRGKAGPWDEIVLTAMDGDVSTAHLLRSALAARGVMVEDLATRPSPYIKLPATWEAYLAGLPGSGRYLINRSLRDFDRWAGPGATLERVRTAADLAKGQRILVLLHQERWQAAGRNGVFASQIFSEFHASVWPELLAREALELVWLEVHGQPVAVAYNIVWDNKVLFYQGGRTVDVPKGVRPGIVLHARLIKAAIEAGRSEYDFLPGLSQYKLQLATDSHPVVALRAVRASVRELACRTIDRGIAYAREVARQEQMRQERMRQAVGPTSPGPRDR
jgi:CelD/BcsL family acetyltransferase involved in cellulose biosynthesis